MLCQQRLHYFWAVSEIRTPESLEDASKINKPAPRSKVKDAERACYGESAPIREGSAGTVVHEYQIGVDCGCKGYGRALPLIQSDFSSILARIFRVRSNLNPIWHICAPCPHLHWRSNMRKLTVHRLWKKNFGKQPREQVNRIDQEQVINRPRIGNDEPHAS